MNFVRTKGYGWVIWKMKYFSYVFRLTRNFDPGFSGNFRWFWNPRGFWVNFLDWFSIPDKGPSGRMIPSSTAAKPRNVWRPRTASEILWWLGGKLRFGGWRIEGLWLSKVDCRIFCRSGEPGPKSGVGHRLRDRSGRCFSEEVRLVLRVDRGRYFPGDSGGGGKEKGLWKVDMCWPERDFATVSIPFWRNDQCRNFHPWAPWSRIPFSTFFPCKTGSPCCDRDQCRASWEPGLFRSIPGMGGKGNRRQNWMDGNPNLPGSGRKRTGKEACTDCGF